MWEIIEVLPVIISFGMGVAVVALLVLTFCVRMPKVTR